MDLSLKIHQYRGDKKTVLRFVFLVVLESRFQLFRSKLECRAFDIDFGAILELELELYLNTVDLSDKIIIRRKITIYFNLYKHDLKI